MSDIKNLTDAQLEAAMDHPHTLPHHRDAVQNEIARRTSVKQVEWNIVGEALEADSDECKECHHWYYEYYTDTGKYTSCNLLEMDGGDPRMCLAFDRIKKEMENE